MAKKKRQKSKAALATAEKRRAERGEPARTPEGERIPVEAERRGGVMSNMRSGFQAVAGTGGSKKQKSKASTVLWVVVLGAAAFFFATQFR